MVRAGLALSFPQARTRVLDLVVSTRAVLPRAAQAVHKSWGASLAQGDRVFFQNELRSCTQAGGRSTERGRGQRHEMTLKLDCSGAYGDQRLHRVCVDLGVRER